MRRLVLLTLAALVAAPAAAQAPAPAAPLVLGAPADTLLEYRLTEVTRLRYEQLQLEVTGGTPEQAAAFEAQIRAALKTREGEQTTQYKQFLKVLPAGDSAGKYLLNTLTLTTPAVSSRSLRTLGKGAGLAYQSETPANLPASLAALLGQVSDELARTHAELVSAFDPASFGLLGDKAGTLTPGQTFTRLRTVQSPQPFASLPGQKRLGLPLQVEQALRFERQQGGQLVFSRTARVVQPGQITAGSVNMVQTLSRYVYDGSLRLTPDGLPVSATRDEAYAVQVTGQAKQGDVTAKLSFNVVATSVLTLTPVAASRP